MKKLVLSLVILLFTTITVVAQGINRDRIKALKTAHITNALSLTSIEAEKFWPVYNEFDQKIHQIKIVKTRQLTRKIQLAGGIEKLSEAEADAVLREFIEIDFNIANEKKKLHKNLTGIISSKKMIKLLKAEQSFNKELLKRLREKRLKRN
ncbi:MAG: sensor of ECF-type sigma factor [Flavobacteriaceae bacterium]|nr:sensor of ECF-type sigma factor [Flavobacteriaceae bacterium]